MNTPRFHRSHNFASEQYKDGKRRYPFMYSLLVSNIPKYTKIYQSQRPISSKSQLYNAITKNYNYIKKKLMLTSIRNQELKTTYDRGNTKQAKTLYFHRDLLKK